MFSNMKVSSGVLGNKEVNQPLFQILIFVSQLLLHWGQGTVSAYFVIKYIKLQAIDVALSQQIKRRNE